MPRCQEELQEPFTSTRIQEHASVQEESTLINCGGQGVHSIELDVHAKNSGNALYSGFESARLAYRFLESHRRCMLDSV